MYETEDKFLTNNYTKGRPGLDMLPFFIVHTYNGKGRSLYNWFQTNNLGISAHKARFKDGKGERYVRREDTSHGAGNWWANVRGINIEHQDDGNPSDSVRTAELYEGTSRDIAQEAYEIGHKVLNQHNIKPHSEFTSTGCPGGLDINRIRQRSNELLQLLLQPPTPPVPDWKKKAQNIGPTTFIPQQDFKLYNLENGSVIQQFLEGTSITVHYLSGNFYITEFSYNKSIPAGFKKEELEYIKPDVIVFIVETENTKEEYLTEEEARIAFVRKMPSLSPREVMTVYEYNKTKNQIIRIIDRFIKPDEIVYIISIDNVDGEEYKSEEEARSTFEASKLVIEEGSTTKLIEHNKTSGGKEILEQYTKPKKPSILETFIEFIKKFLEFIHVVKP